MGGVLAGFLDSGMRIHSALVQYEVFLDEGLGMLCKACTYELVITLSQLVR